MGPSGGSAAESAELPDADAKGMILTGQTCLRFGSVWFSSVHFCRMRGQNHVRFTLVQYGASC